MANNKRSSPVVVIDETYQTCDFDWMPFKQEEITKSAKRIVYSESHPQFAFHNPDIVHQGPFQMKWPSLWTSGGIQRTVDEESGRVEYSIKVEFSQKQHALLLSILKDMEEKAQKRVIKDQDRLNFAMPVSKDTIRYVMNDMLYYPRIADTKIPDTTRDPTLYLKLFYWENKDNNRIRVNKSTFYDLDDQVLNWEDLSNPQLNLNIVPVVTLKKVHRCAKSTTYSWELQEARVFEANTRQRVSHTRQDADQYKAQNPEAATANLNALHKLLHASGQGLAPVLPAVPTDQVPESQTKYPSTTSSSSTVGSDSAQNATNQATAHPPPLDMSTSNAKRARVGGNTAKNSTSASFLK